jgi:hypothetical protein
LAHGRRALRLQRATGHRHGEARTALLLGHVLHARDETAAAIDSWRAAAVIFKTLGAPEAKDAETRAQLPRPRSRVAPAR